MKPKGRKHHQKKPGRLSGREFGLDVDELEHRINELRTEADSWSPVDISSTSRDDVLSFNALPLSAATRTALASEGFINLTPIQRMSIVPALIGRDLLGEAQTGSGKTLSFTVPLLEKLYRSKWTEFDGLGALVLSPTRELATQIFNVVVKVASNHRFVCGCVIGGNRRSVEEPALGQVNVLVATPGRLQQYMDESPQFDCSNMLLLVVDEADRLVDMGFLPVLKTIVAGLPAERQNLVFSATLSASADELIRTVNLREPVRACTYEDNHKITPEGLQEIYSPVPLEDKIDVLFHFLRTHSSKKIIVFTSTCKQVRFLTEICKKLKSGAAVSELHGRLSHIARLRALQGFTARPAGVLICTDVAARGIDFPKVDWVVQADCPDSVDTYVHRVGRTARNHATGNGILFLSPSEMEFLKRLKDAGLELKPQHVCTKRVPSQAPRLRQAVAADNELKFMGQRAFVAYFRSIHLMPDKKVFNARTLPVEAYATSLGLGAAPEVRFNDEAEATCAGGTGTGTDINSKQSGWGIATNALKQQKNLSKLQRLKSKIAEKKNKSMSVPATGGDTKSANDKNVKDVCSGDTGGDDELLREVPMEESTLTKLGSTPLVDARLKREAMGKALARQQIRFKADGTAVVKGAALASEQMRQHKVFDQSDDEASDGDSSTDGGGASGEFTNHADYVALLKRRLADCDETDKTRQRDRLRLKKRKVNVKGFDSITGTEGVTLLNPPGPDSDLDQDLTDLMSEF